MPQASALAGLMRAIVAIFTKNELRGVNRDRFQKIAQDLNLSPPDLYELLTGRRLSAGALEKRLAADLERSPQLGSRLRAIQEHRSASIRASLPIGPPCC
ncbi:MAG: hypothetical protein Q8R73_09415 [Bradyrhizobium sp.]|nr:hypothetical protein [Bradyrhizobium sp.]